MIKSISIVIPFYNEKKRILSCLNQVKKFKNNKIISEFIFVDDGSNDGTDLTIKNFLKKNYKKGKLIKNKKNMGKGYALKMGVLKSKNQWILTTDMDMSVPLKQILIWIKNKYLNKECSIYFGSREHKDSKVEAKIYRKILGNIFRIIIKVLLKIKIKDTQCGYKLYKNIIGKKIFRKLTMNKFEHDLEIVLNAKNLNQSIVELPIKWSHKSSSKLNVFIDPIKMLYGIILLSFRSKIQFE
jgi:glycosyltransferase involved in cell wall biosynthesis